MTYDPPDGHHTQAIPPGTAALRAQLAEHFKIQRHEVVRDKSRCDKQRSEHCEARAVDLFVNAPDPRGRAIFEWVVANHDLGLQSVIWNRRVWGFGNQTERRYTGPNPHTDHVHIGLTVHGSQVINRAEVARRLAGEDEMSQEQYDSLKGALDYVAGEVEKRTNAIQETLAHHGNAIDEMRRAIATMQTGGDWDALAVRVADLMAKRLAE